VVQIERRERKTALVTVAATIFVFAGTATATAATVEATFTGVSPSGSVKYELARPSTGQSTLKGTTTGGVFNFTRNGGTAPVLLPDTPVSKFVGFCLELNEYIGGSSPGSTHTWTLGDLKDAPIDAGGTITGGMKATKADQIARLLGHVLPSFSAAPSLTPDKALALQISIWEIVHETFSGGYGLASGIAKFSAITTGEAAAIKISEDAISLASGWLAVIHSGSYSTLWSPARNLYAITLDGVQDYVVQVVPIPAAAWLLGSGLLGLFAVARRKKTAV